MRLEFNEFGGEIPKTKEYDTPHNVATATMDLDLRDGRLRAWRDTTLSFYFSGGNSMYAHGCDYLVWQECVSAAASTVDAATILLVGRKEYAEQLRLKGGVQEYARLGLPAPTRVFASNLNEKSVNRTTYPTRYVITFENAYGQEGPPSPPSQEVHLDEEVNFRIAIRGLNQPVPDEYRISKVNIYRLAHPYRSGEEEAPLKEDSLFVRVASVPYGRIEHVDTVKTINAGIPLMTEEFREPPKGMQQIKAIPGTNSFVGWRGHQLFFSENNRYWNWPAAFDMTLDRNIKHIEVVGDKLIVSTTGAPYIVSDLRTCEKRICRPVDEITLGNVGDIGCDTLNGSVATPFGMVYPTVDGLVSVSASGDMTLLTSAYFSARQWAQLRPDTTKLAYWSGLLLCHTEEIAFFMRLDESTFATEGKEGITQISDFVRGLHTNSDGQLFLLKEDGVHHWNSANEFREFLWENNHLGADMKQTFNAFRASAEDVKVTLKGNESQREFSPIIVKNRSTRLGRLGRNNTYTVTITGKGSLEYFTLGSSILEVSRNEGKV